MYAILPNCRWSQVGWVWLETSAEDLKRTMAFFISKGSRKFYEPLVLSLDALPLGRVAPVGQ